MAKASEKTESVRGDDSKKEDKKLCMGIMPFREPFNNYWQSVYIPAIEEAGMVAKRADDVFLSSDIVRDIWAMVREADILFADLSTRNANVMYEVGLAHAIQKPVVMVTDSIDDVPFDLRGLRTFEYVKDDPRWGDTLKEKLVKAFKETLERPMEAVPSAFIQAKADAAPVVDETRRELIELSQAVEAMRRDIRGGRALPGTAARWGVPRIETHPNLMSEFDSVRELAIRDVIVRLLSGNDPNAVRQRLSEKGRWYLSDDTWEEIVSVAKGRVENPVERNTADED